MARPISRSYRIYSHDGASKILSAEWIDASGDEQAIAAAERMFPGLQCEIWDGKRLVASIEADRRQA